MRKAFVTAIFALFACLPALAQEKEAQDEARELQRSLRELREEISRLHLLNSLELTLEQAQELKMLLDNLKLARELFTQQSLSHQKEMVEVLGEIRDSLAEGAQEVPEELAAKYNGLRKKSAEANKEFFKKLKGADEELSTILTGEQRAAIEKYDEDPLKRTQEGPQGKESRLGQVAKLLDRVRGMAPEQYEQVREKLMGQFIGKLTKDRSVPRQQVQAARRKIDEVIKKAQRMDELEYMLWREEFAKQLLELANPPKRTGMGRRADRRQKGPELSKAGTLLLHEGMLEALEAKIEILKKAGEDEKPSEPESGEPGQD